MDSDFLNSADVDVPYFVWKPRDKPPAISRLRLYQQHGRVIAIATERHDNPSQSLTNGAEEAIAAAIAQYALPSAKLLWIEHYPQDSVAQETFSLVICSQHPRTRHFLKPQWFSLSRQDVAALIDGNNTPLERITLHLATADDVEPFFREEGWNEP